MTAFLTLLSLNTIAAPTPISIQFDEEHQYQYAGFYAAQWKGLYQDRHLDVTLLPAKRRNNEFHNVIDDVVNGRATIGIASADLLEAYSDGLPVVALSTIFQLSDIALYTGEYTLIASPADLAKLRIVSPPDPKYRLPLLYLLALAGVDNSKIEYKIHDDPLAAFSNNSADVIVGSMFTTPYLAEQRDLEVKEISLANFGLDIPGKTLFTSGDNYRKNHHEIDQFILATLDGWKYALRNGDEIALELTRRKLSQSRHPVTYGMSFFQVDQVRKLSMYPVVQPGNTTFDRWKRTYDVLSPVMGSKKELSDNFLHDPVANAKSRAIILDKLQYIGLPLTLVLVVAMLLLSNYKKRSRQEYETQLRLQASSDSLTGLPNRDFAFKKLSDCLDDRTFSQTPFHLMFLDLDGFKSINDTTGHSTGDKLLVKVTRRLANVLTENEWLARIGGDEFLIFTDTVSKHYVNALADNILSALKKPFVIEENMFHIGVSIGVANYPWHGNDVQALLSHADSAMYCAKDSGKNQVVHFTHELSLVAKEKLQIASQLSEALENKEFSVCYQPIVKVDTEKVIGAEALLRWNNPALGFVPPDRFIPVAEETGVIREIGEWVLKTAVRDMMHWNKNRASPIYVSVNVSPRQFQDSNFYNNTVLDTLVAHRAPTNLLKLEITENLLINDSPSTAKLLDEFAKTGIDIYLDDFGTGYSSLCYLKTFPMHTIKIDRQFTNDVMDDPTNRSLVTAIIAMARGLNMRVICEGVEDCKQLEFLASLNCDYAQGYYFSKPVHLDAFIEYIKEQQTAKQQTDIQSVPKLLTEA